MENLLQNGDFERDWGEDESHDVLILRPDEPPQQSTVGNIFTPSGGWLTWYQHDPGVWDQPEARDAWATHDPHRVHTGEKATLLFTFYRKHDAGFLQQVQVEPGQRLRLIAWAHAWSNADLEGHEDCLDDGRCSCGVGQEVVAIAENDIPPLNGDPWNDAFGNFLFSLGIDPTGGADPRADTVVWGPAWAIYNGYCQQLSVEAEAQESTVTVFLRSVTLWPFKHNDAYWDDAELIAVDEEPPAPPPYESTMLVLPQDATPEQLQEVFALAFPDRRTFGFSHDDAGILNGTSVCYNIPGDEKQAYLDFYAERYPGVTVEFAYTSDWEEPPVPPSGLLLWQCDPRWGDEKIASPDCSLTLCQTGCWVSDAAMAQRFFDIEPDATPSTANQALGAVNGFAGCLTTWDGMKAALGLEVFEKHYDDQKARDWLDDGFICFAEVEPQDYTHFVLITRHSEGRFWMHDSYKNVEGWLDEHYPGVESWRSIRPFEEELPPVRGSLVSLHLQSLVDGVMAPNPTLAALRCFKPSQDMSSDLRKYVIRYQETLEAALGFVERVEPSVIKVFQLEVAREIKTRSPETLVVLRYYTPNQNLSGNLADRAREYVASFEDSLRTNAEQIDYVESYNEEIPTNDTAKLQLAVEFDCHFADALMALGLPVAPALLNVAVGNPSHEGGEIELMLPAVSKAVQYGGALSYHAYGLAVNGGNLNDAWEYYAGRALEGWDPVFRAHGLYPHYIFGECGAFATCSDGWRASNCLDGDWPLYLAQLTEFSDRIKIWNASHGNRCLGGTLFTSGGFGSWPSFEITEAEMTDPNWPT